MAEKLQRELSNRHIQLIAIGGAIGTAILRRWSNDCINWPFYITNIYHYWIYVIYVYARFR